MKPPLSDKTWKLVCRDRLNKGVSKLLKDAAKGLKADARNNPLPVASRAIKASCNA